MADEKLEKPDECECCGYKTAALKRYTGVHGSQTPPGGVTDWYCDLCANTQASTMTRYFGLYSSDSRHIVQAICYVGNAILDEIRRGRPSPDQTNHDPAA